MILVDIYVPSLDETFDFQLDEKMTALDAAQAIARILGSHLRSEDGEGGRFILCSLDKEEILPAGKRLNECGIMSGCRLLLV